MITNNRDEVEKVKVELNCKFDMKDLRVARKILKIKITRWSALKRLYVPQETYLKKILNKFGMKNLKSVFTPITFHYKLSDKQSRKTVEEYNYISNIPYTNNVDSIMYVMIWTRLDIAYILSVVIRFMLNPGWAH